MGLERVVPGAAAPLAELSARLVAANLGCTIVMIDGALVLPTAPFPATWREVRLRAPEGTVTLVRRGDDLVLVVFGNADAGLRTLQEKLAEALAQKLT